MEEEQREAQTERERREEGKDTQRERLRDTQTQREARREGDKDGNTETRKGCRNTAMRTGMRLGIPGTGGHNPDSLRPHHKVPQGGKTPLSSESGTAKPHAELVVIPSRHPGCLCVTSWGAYQCELSVT